jgi:hypothetical protein
VYRIVSRAKRAGGVVASDYTATRVEFTHHAFDNSALNRQAILAELSGSMLGPLGQACLAGIVLNITASVVAWYLWRRDAGERYLAGSPPIRR